METLLPSLTLEAVEAALMDEGKGCTSDLTLL